MGIGDLQVPHWTIKPIVGTFARERKYLFLSKITNHLSNVQQKAERAAFDGILTNPDVPLMIRRGAAKRFVNLFKTAKWLGYKFSDAGTGGCNGNFLGIGADCCQRAVLVEAIQPIGLQITNGEFVGRWGSTDAVTLEIGARAKGKVSLVNCNFWGPINCCIRQSSPLSQLTASSCNFVNWDSGQKGYAALQIDAGKAIVQGNTFGAGRHHIAIGSKAASAIVAFNQGESGIEVDNQAGARTQIVANEVPAAK